MRPRTLVALLIVVAVITLPAIAQDAPAPAPQATESRARADVPEILVLPLVEIAERGDQSWIGRAMHQSMLAEIARLHFVEPVAPRAGRSVPDAHDADAARSAARDAGAEFVLFGSYQTVGDELRVTGQILDVASGDVIGGLKATGALRDLFGIEDILATQIKRELAIRLIDPDEALAGAPTTMPTEVAPSGPVQRQPELNGYAGSELERAVLSGTIEPTIPAAEEEHYRYTEQPYIWTRPYTVTPYPYFPYRNYYRHDHRGRRTIVSGTVIPPGGNDLPPNNNFIVGPGNTMTRSLGNTMTGGPGNTMQGGPGNTMTGGLGNTMQGGPGNTMQNGPGNTMQNGPTERTFPQRQADQLRESSGRGENPTRFGNILRRGAGGRITGTPARPSADNDGGDR